jgi:rod shape-determining protein MreD
MMPRAADQLLLPANPFFIAATLAAGLAFDLMPLGRNPLVPDLLALALAFWIVHQPQRVGIGIAFCLGLLMDVHDSALLGQHALGYTLLGYFALAASRRLPWFSLPMQALQMLPLFLLAHAVTIAARLLVGGMVPGWNALFAPLLESLLWPLACWLLLAPQRRPPDPDKNRPL